VGVWGREMGASGPAARGLSAAQPLAFDLDSQERRAPNPDEPFFELFKSRRDPGKSSFFVHAIGLPFRKQLSRLPNGQRRHPNPVAGSCSPGPLDASEDSERRSVGM
jgi:hypothetical protein